MRAGGLTSLLGKEVGNSGASPIRDAGYRKTVKCVEPTFPPRSGGCEVAVVVLPVCVLKRCGEILRRTDSIEALPTLAPASRAGKGCHVVRRPKAKRAFLGRFALCSKSKCFPAAKIQERPPDSHLGLVRGPSSWH